MGLSGSWGGPTEYGAHCLHADSTKEEEQVTMFIPSPYSDLGDGETEDEPAPSTSPANDYEALIKEYAPVLRVGLEQITDPTQQTEVLRARIKNARQILRRSPPILRPTIARRIRVMEAKLRAAERRQGIQRETESAQRTYRALTQSVIAGGIVIAVALTALIVKKTRT
jgi:hypothetical protein